MTTSATPNIVARLIDYVRQGFNSPSEESLQRRFLVGGALLGIGVALVSASSAFLTGFPARAVLIAAFAAGLVLLLTAVRAGATLSVLRGLTLGLLGALFVSVALLTRELRWGQMKWLSLLPVVALFLGEARQQGGSPAPPARVLLGSTLLALLLAVAVVVANRAGWTAGLDGPAAGLSSDADSLLDSVLFTITLSGLMWIHHVALRKSEEELAALRSMLSVCAWCRRIRDDQEGWIVMERYVASHSPTQLTHGICPDCERKTLEEMEQGSDARHE